MIQDCWTMVVGAWPVAMLRRRAWVRRSSCGNLLVLFVFRRGCPVSERNTRRGSPGQADVVDLDLAVL